MICDIATENEKDPGFVFLLKAEHNIDWEHIDRFPIWP